MTYPPYSCIYGYDRYSYPALVWFFFCSEVFKRGELVVCWYRTVDQRKSRMAEASIVPHSQKRMYLCWVFLRPDI